MNIIIPLGGKGERFAKEGYCDPKPLIRVLHKEMIRHVIDRLSIRTDEDQVFILYAHSLETYGFRCLIEKFYQYIHLVPICHQTSGAVETILYGLPQIRKMSPHKKCVVLDCDTFYTEDILSMVRECETSMVFYTKKYNEPPIYSYIQLDPSDGRIVSIREKEKISDNANTGCYVFHDIHLLHVYCKDIMDRRITFNGEPYTSCVIGEMIRDHVFVGTALDGDNVVSLGTPRELSAFIDRAYVCLFDLDGTLVKTDPIYLDVWRDLLSHYNIHLTDELFAQYIQGNSDESVARALLPTVNVSELSALKDRLFLQHISRVEIVDGAIAFITELRKRGIQCSIVTNCNRMVAEQIIAYCQLNSHVDYITVGSECARPKPHPDPYNETIDRYGVAKERVIIFEDSKSGLLSARLANVRCVVGITTNYPVDELRSCGADLTIDTYEKLKWNRILSIRDNHMDHLAKYIRNSLNIPIRDVIVDESKLKGGYISDVISVTLITHTDPIHCVLKLENDKETPLSIMAKMLGLYDRENYFYDSISRYINIRCPLFYGLIRNDALRTIGILMEKVDLDGSCFLNVNLNTAPIHVSLQVIDQLALFHAKYWNKPLERAFSGLKKHNDSMFRPTWTHFIEKRWTLFLEKWSHILTPNQLRVAETLRANFDSVQEKLSHGHLTMIHGDVKSANLFYDVSNNYMPIFIDWQYVAIGKGVQDLIFFLIESLDMDHIRLYYPIFKNYYYRKLNENRILDYLYTDYERDLYDAIGYFPFFVAVWFGTTPTDELIDPNFPFFFIQKLFSFLDFLQESRESK
jgi:HAD superfamily hydrolase (TIGR01509 family)